MQIPDAILNNSHHELHLLHNSGVRPEALHMASQGHSASEFTCRMRDVYIPANLEIDPCGAEMISLWGP